jgi:acetyl esterase/lipase
MWHHDDVIGWLFLAASLVGAAFTYNAYRPRYAPSTVSGFSFFAGWLTSELALHHIAWQIALTVGFVWLGALRHGPGMVALAITVVSWIGLVVCFWQGWDAEHAIEAALADGLGTEYLDRIPPDLRARLAHGLEWRPILMPFPIRHAEVERVRDLAYARAGGRDLRLDVFRHRDRPTGRPVLVYVHGGGWVVGSKNEQGLPLLGHLAARGWVGVSIDYRLSPHATFPDHLVDVKRAIAWVRAHVAEYGGDPGFIVLAGGSAGGHLAALAALTPGDPEYQPGFEDADTAVQGCVAFYGVYDFTDRDAHWPHRGLLNLLERHVMKASLEEAHDAFARASPLHRVHGSAPPFLVVHGDRDTLVPVGQARQFSEALRAAGVRPVVYAEIAGAQHAFEIFPSLRTAFVVQGVERFLGYLYGRHVGTVGASETRKAAS